ncbi:MAG: chemotaxis protein [Deltaproteobacteria bacterium HGW-Deltaproteobacteria-15]|jgi:putative nucleotidyltransferase with HDIG domain|nr:MAG: chemotaxis protein [Deltaproteobacteria bacterium HGW-Deltaproteobacteria-15]
MKDIQKILQGIDRLHPIPHVAEQVMLLARDPESSMSRIAEIITYDQILTANLLKTCNSSYFSVPKKVDSVQQAIVFVGIDQVVDLVWMSGGAANFRKRQDGYDLEEGDLWKYSVSSALISRELAEKRKMDNSHLVFTAALLKDIGKVVLSQYVADSFEKINLLVTQYGYSFMEAEKAVIGIDHAELGGLVAEKWGYSPKMVEIIRSHHLTDESTEFDLETSIVYLADTLCMMIGVGVGSDGLAYRFRKDVIDKLGFSDRDFQEVMAGFGEKLRKVEELIHA